MEEVQESWVCSSNDREGIQVKKAHLEGVINQDNIYSVGTCRFYTKCCICINSFKSHINTKVATIIIPIQKMRNQDTEWTSDLPKNHTAGKWQVPE